MSSQIDFMMSYMELDTDFLKFEKVAIEVLETFGYHDIIPFGGYKDKGIDAKEENFYKGKLKNSVIFQFSMEMNTEKKVKKLLKNYLIMA